MRQPKAKAMVKENNEESGKDYTIKDKEHIY